MTVYDDALQQANRELAAQEKLYDGLVDRIKDLYAEIDQSVKKRTIAEGECSRLRRLVDSLDVAARSLE